MLWKYVKPLYCFKNKLQLCTILCQYKTLASECSVRRFNSLMRQTSELNINTHLNKLKKGLNHPCKCNSRLSYGYFGTLLHTPSQTFATKSNLDLETTEEKLEKYLSQLEEEFVEAERCLTNPTEKSENELKAAGRIVVELKMLVDLYRQQKEKLQEMSDLTSIIKGDDQEMAALAESEQQQCKLDLKDLQSKVLELLIPPEPADHNDIILEATAGVGGQEAMLFNGEVFQMYANLAARNGWQWTVLSYEEGEAGGVRRASASVSGQSVYSFMKYEGGVHRVQRIPATEKSGRIHTSTIAVSIIPQPSEIDIVLNPKDLKIETFRSSGAGGQHVNKTESAVRITHLPTGTVAECQTGRSQIHNKEEALQILRSRMYEAELEAQLEQTRSQRKIQVGSRSRAEKIRTYNFPQDRVTDHRIGQNLFNLGEFMLGGEGLEGLIQDLQQESRKERLQEILQGNIRVGLHKGQRKQ